MSYGRFSRYYDRLMGDFPYDEYARYLAPLAKGKGLDLGCGTGRMTILLAARGVQMQGVDLSEEMLNIAVANTRKAGLRVDFRCEDMRAFSFASGYDLITAVCDGVNYLAPHDLPAFFQRVKQALAEGGHFVFDVSTPYKLREVLGDNLYYEDYDDLTYYWHNRLFPARQVVRLSLTFFEKEGEHYRRFDEEQVQYWHTTQQLIQAAAQSGLALVASCDGDTFGKVKAKSTRIVYTFAHS